MHPPSPRGPVALALGLGSFSLGCSGDRVLLWPESEGLSSAVIVAFEPLQVVAQPLDAVVRVEDVARIELFLYDESLEALGLAMGGNEPGQNCRPCSLATPAAAFSFESALADDGTTPEAFVPLEVSNALGLEVLIPDAAARCTRCPEFEFQTVAFESPSEGARIRSVPFGPDRAIIHVPPDFVLMTVGEDGVAEELCRSLAFTLGLGSFVDAQARLWMGLADGRVLALDTGRLSPGEPCEVATTTITSAFPAASGGLVWLDGGETEEGTELYGLAGDGSILHYLGGRWERIDAQVAELEEAQRIAWLGPGRAMAVDGRNQLYVVEDGSRLETPRLEDPRGLVLDLQAFTIAAHPSLGAVLGSRHHLLVRWMDGQAAPLGGEFDLSSDRVEGLMAHGDGVFFTARNGGVRAWYPGHGYCPRQDMLTNASIKSIAPIGRDRWVLSGPTVHVARPVESVRRCE